MIRFSTRPATVTALLAGMLLAAAGCGKDDDGGTGPGGGDPITFPLTVGNMWTYSATTDSTTRSVDTITMEVVGTDTFGGQTFSAVEETRPDGTETILMRQDGQDFLVVFPFGSDGGRLGDPVESWIDQTLSGTQPWKFADLDAADGATWMLASADTTVDQGGGMTSSISISAMGVSHGRTSVTVPGGTYADAYEGALQLTLSVDGDVQNTASQTIWVADGVGLVKMVQVETSVGRGGTTFLTETREMTSVQVN